MMLRAVLKSPSLNYCVCPFFGIAMKFYDKQISQNEKDDLSAVNLKKLDIENFDISMYLSDGGFKDKSITAFAEANPRLWIKEH